MVTKAQQADYLVESLRGSDERVEPKTKIIVGDADTNYILVGENGIVLLVDRVYPNETFRRAYNLAIEKKSKIGVVFFKDGETFFRNAAETHGFKERYDLSLKNYNPEQVRQMISFRPEEIFAHGTGREWLQYYQPSSGRLEQGLESFKFVPVTFDYSHIPEGRFQPEDRDSKRIHLWTERRHFTGLLGHKGRYLVQRQLTI